MPNKKPLPVPKGKIAKRQEAFQATKQQDRTGIIAAVKTPLGFFALVVLAVEAILGATTVLSRLTEAHQFIVVMLMISILVVMIFVVAGIAIFKPSALSPEMGETALKAAQAEREAKLALNATIELKEVFASPDFQEIIGQIVEERLHGRLLPNGKDSDGNSKSE